MDLMERIADCATQGMMCSQMVAMFTLETLGIENKELIRSLYGLGGGVALTKHTCGCMTGGCCAISYFTGKAGGDEKEDLRHKEALDEYMEWFKTVNTEKYGGWLCRDIISDDWNNMYERCDELIAESYQKIMEILTEKGIVEL
ncbi:MAG: C-GCAxxG-C-C family protein [Lachnospiraceae bacterium]|nr:C-GCAxxG-C-C family protein [Lachnospiraceae bacterium]